MSDQEKDALLDHFFKTNAIRPKKEEYEEDELGMFRLPKSLHQQGKKPSNPRHKKTTSVKSSKPSFKKKKEPKKRHPSDELEEEEEPHFEPSFNDPFTEESEGKLKSI